jgi:hypothetical protein
MMELCKNMQEEGKQTLKNLHGEMFNLSLEDLFLLACVGKIYKVENNG